MSFQKKLVVLLLYKDSPGKVLGTYYPMPVSATVYADTSCAIIRLPRAVEDEKQ